MSTPKARADFDTFCEIVNDELGYLVTEYRYTVIEARLLIPGMWMTFRTTGSSAVDVVVPFEYGGGVWIVIHHVEVSADSKVLHGERYGLHKVFAMRGIPMPTVKEWPHDFDENIVREHLHDLGVAMRVHVDDLLRNDAKAFDLLRESRRAGVLE